MLWVFAAAASLLLAPGRWPAASLRARVDPLSMAESPMPANLQAWGLEEELWVQIKQKSGLIKLSEAGEEERDEWGGTAGEQVGCGRV